MSRINKAVIHIWLASLAILTAFFIRPSLFEPLRPAAFDHTEKRLKALWIGAMEYHVDYASFPVIRPSETHRSALTSPIAYMSATFPDPFSIGNKAKAEELDVNGRLAMNRVRTLHVLVLLFGLAVVVLGVFPLKPWGVEQMVILLFMFCIPVLTLALLAHLGPEKMGTISLLLFLACPWALFIFKKLSIEALALFGLSALMMVIGLYRRDHGLLWTSVILIGIGGARVSMSSGALGKTWLEGWRARRVSLALQVEVSALCLTIVAGLTAILLSDWILRERKGAQEIEYSGMPFTVLSDSRFFLASSNGPDFQRDWSEGDFLRLLEKNGTQGAETYLTARTYDPTNGTTSAGDYIIFADRPDAPLIRSGLLPKSPATEEEIKAAEYLP